MNQRWIKTEVEDILAMFAALEKANPAIEFEGFDSESAGMSTEPYEGDHLECARHLRGWPDTPRHWPEKSHGRNLSTYRRMLQVWTSLGKLRDLSSSQAKQIELEMLVVK